MAERQLPSPESCYTRYEVSLPCDTQVLNCTRVCTSHRKVETGLDLWRSRAETLDIPVSTYLARGVTSPIPISETSRTRTDLGRSTSTSRAHATRHAPAEPPLPSDREGGGHHRTGEPAFTAPLFRVPDYAESPVDSGRNWGVEPSLVGIILTLPRHHHCHWEAFVKNSTGCIAGSKAGLAPVSWRGDGLGSGYMI